jgi:Co/Zn/Cd efflux system component
MKAKKNPVNPKILLWWVAIISLVISAMLYFLLKEQAQYDVSLDQRRMLFHLLGIIFAGICIITGTAGRWFYDK